MECKSCKYFQENAECDQYGECRRYPKYMDILGSYWCGEYLSHTNPTNYFTVEQYLGLSNETIIEIRQLYYELGGDDPISPAKVRRVFTRGYEPTDTGS